MLASTDAFRPLDEPVTVVFEEDAGLVPVAIERRKEGRIRCELQAPQGLTLGTAVPVEDVAATVSLSVERQLIAIGEAVNALL